jgi:hypothetical protein
MFERLIKNISKNRKTNRVTIKDRSQDIIKIYHLGIDIFSKDTNYRNRHFLVEIVIDFR